MFTEEIIEEVMDDIDVNSITSCNSDYDVSPRTRRLLSSTSAHFLDEEPNIRTPLLPETVDLSRVQNLDPALALTAPFLPELVNPNQAQNLDLAFAEINLEGLYYVECWRSNRLKKTNPKFVGKEWENPLDKD